MEHNEAVRMLKAIATAFDEHDLDGIMVHFTADAVFEGPRGRTVGPAVRRAGGDPRGLRRPLRRDP